jgi:hypothetical protein
MPSKLRFGEFNHAVDTLLRNDFDPLESSNELLRVWGHPDFKKKLALRPKSYGLKLVTA